VKARIGVKSVPVARDREVSGGGFTGINSLLQPSKGEIVLSSVGVQAGDAHA
jgi:hypothetical protein